MTIIDYVSIKRCIPAATKEQVEAYIEDMKRQGHIIKELPSGQIQVYNKFLPHLLIGWIR